MRLLALFLTAALAWADLSQVRSEPNLEKRAERALQYADQAITQARKLYEAGEVEQYRAALGEVRESVDLTVESLRATGKSASRSPKHFKRAELATRMLVRRLESLAREVGFDDREPAEKTRDHTRAAQEQFLLGIMEKKK